jgi:hypothetical protein
MKLLLAIVAVVIVAASILADYKWRQWMSSRRRDGNDTNLTPRA